MNEVEKSFSRVAHHYQKQARIQSLIGERLIQRLDYIKLAPKRILDLGAGPGHFSFALQKRFPRAEVISFDIAIQMLQQSKRRFRRYPMRVLGDMNTLPFIDKSIDLIFANQSLHWSCDFPMLCKEINRALKPDGLLLFSTLGPDTFKEIRQAFSAVDDYQHVNHFDDMHDIGDALFQVGLRNPVVDMDYMIVRYRTVKDLCRDLKSQGVKNINGMRQRGLLTPKKWGAFERYYDALRDKEGLLPLSYEAIYGQAWGQEIASSLKEVCVPISTLKRKVKT